MRRLKHDQLISELQEHIAELAHEASAGSYPAREWLLWAFPGHVSYFRQQWSKPAAERRPVEPEKV